MTLSGHRHSELQIIHTRKIRGLANNPLSCLNRFHIIEGYDHADNLI